MATVSGPYTPIDWSTGQASRSAFAVDPRNGRIWGFVNSSNSNEGAAVIYSDDQGATWQEDTAKAVTAPTAHDDTLIAIADDGAMVAAYHNGTSLFVYFIADAVVGEPWTSNTSAAFSGAMSFAIWANRLTKDGSTYRFHFASAASTGALLYSVVITPNPFAVTVPAGSISSNRGNAGVAIDPIGKRAYAASLSTSSFKVTHSPWDTSTGSVTVNLIGSGVDTVNDWVADLVWSTRLNKGWAGTIDVSASSLLLFDFTSAVATFTARATLTGLTAGQRTALWNFIVGADDILYAVGHDFTNGDVFYYPYDIGANTWGARVNVVTASPNVVEQMGLAGAFTRDGRRFFINQYGTTGDSTINRFWRVDVSLAPTAPTVTAPEANVAAKLTDGVDFAWTHNDPESDPQAAWAIKRRAASLPSAMGSATRSGGPTRPRRS
jgi:hypothetical protein